MNELSFSRANLLVDHSDGINILNRPFVLQVIEKYPDHARFQL